MLSSRRPTDNAVSEVNLLPEDGKIQIEILLDRTSVEIYANGGKVPMAFFYIPEDENKEISLVCNAGNVLLYSMDVYELNSIWE